jgi:hypothetical protein
LGGGHTGHSTGAGAQAAVSTISMKHRMWIIYLEIVLALGLAAFIVWFTWPKKRK